ncbi:MAG: T9SS type A sorting domain-containing protein [Bacteroidales bacterium]|nr:T9SS type A sorting domain-containing protein [Bacteroidales bacterium]
MKPIQVLILACILLMNQSIHSQELNEWQGVELITDTISDNHNPFIINWDGLFIYWERSAPEATLICCKSLYNLQAEVDTVLFEPGVHFRNPRGLKLSPYQQLTYDAEFLLVYERWENDEGHVAYLKFYGDGTYSDPILISEEIVPMNSVFSRDGIGIVWMDDGRIMFSNLTNNAGFEQPVVVDSGNYRMPVITPTFYFACLAEIGDQTNLMTFSNGPEPQIEYEADTLFDLTTELNLGMNGNMSHISFGSIENQLYKAQIYRLETSTLTEIIYPEGVEKFFPSVMSLEVPVKKTYLPCMATFVSDTGDGKEIFADGFFTSPSTQNISNYQGTDTKPKLFYGATGFKEGIRVEMICVWESNRNNHCALAMNKIWMDIPGNTDEGDHVQKAFSIKPNPMSNSTTIEYTLKEKGEVSIQIYDQHGKLIDHLLNEEKAAGTHQVQWNGTTFNGKPVPAGVYLVKMETAGLSQTGKLIINK